MVEPNTRWQQPVPTVPRTGIVQGALNLTDGRTVEEHRIDEQWRAVLINRTNLNYPGSLNATAPGGG